VARADRDQPIGTAALRWSLRRLWPVALCLLLIGVLAGFTASQVRNDGKYQATALVVARQLTLKQEQLPRLGEAIFASGAVARRVAADQGLRRSPESMIPGVIDLNPLTDTVVFQVFGYGSTRGQSVRIANSAADAFVKELNKPGPFIGSFAVQAYSNSDVKAPTTRISPIAALFGGGLLGLVAAVCFLYGYAAVRRPVLDVEGVLVHVDAPVYDAPDLASAEFRKLARLTTMDRPAVYVFLPVVGAVPAALDAGREFSELLRPPSPMLDFTRRSGAATAPCVVVTRGLGPGRPVPEAVFDADRRVIVAGRGTPSRHLVAVLDLVGREFVDGVVLASWKPAGRRRGSAAV
jgi:hypothetical protein